MIACDVYVPSSKHIITKTLKIGFIVWKKWLRKLSLGEKMDYVDLGDLDFSDLDFDSLRNTYGSPAS